MVNIGFYKLFIEIYTGNSFKLGYCCKKCV